MGKRKRVTVVGLPKFASELASNLNSYYPNNRFKSFDTYYKTKDKIACIPYILLSDVVYSINGTINNSNVFNLALKLNKKLVIHWVGTDVLKAQKAFKKGEFNQEYIDKATHLCEVDWIQEELKEFGINAEIQNFVVFDKIISDQKLPEKFSVLSYLYPGREEFYGINSLIEAANKFPDIEFNLVGPEFYKAETPSNMRFHGWVNDLDSRIASAGMCVRYPEHDGLSSFVLESLANGKVVAYKYDYPHCIACYNSEDLHTTIENTYQEFKNGSLKVNLDAIRYIQEEFNKGENFFWPDKANWYNVKKKLIFVSYYFFPNREVGANRIRFWVKDLESYSEYEPVVITATPFTKSERLVKEQYYVAPTGITPISFLIKDEGINWRSPLIDFFQSYDLTNVCGVIMTGGPFMHFSIIRKIKGLMTCPVLLDYRDPFANNPRFHELKVKVWIKRFFEKRFVKCADVITSVNSDCLGLLTGFELERNKFHVIPNGYDEETFKTVKSEPSQKAPTDKFIFIYPGKYYENASPNNTFVAIKELIAEEHKIKFVHYGGKESDSFAVLENDSFIEERGVVDYTEIVQALFDSHVGIIYTEGDVFESTTKVFDYIGAEIPIVVITHGELYSGNIHRITAGYPIVKWCKNNKDEIKQVLLELFDMNLNIEYPDRLNYTRRTGLEKLLAALKL